MSAANESPTPRGPQRDREEQGLEPARATLPPPGAAPRPAGEPTEYADRPGDTCGAYTILQLCEQAHWEVTGEPLCLHDWDHKTKSKEVRNHIKACEKCARWTRNAKRAYEKLVDDVESALHSAPREAELLPAAPTDLVLMRLPPPASGQSPLDACTVHLKWQEPSAPGHAEAPAWSVAVELLPEENDEKVLARLSGCSVLLEWQLSGRDSPEQVLTRLNPGPRRKLASDPRATAVSNPKEELRGVPFTLTLLDLARKAAGD